VLDTLAAAYAAAGRFDEAIETAERALRLASSSNEQALAAAVARRLELYRRGEAVGAGPSPPGAPRH
ncbi:MAG TPA: hypothetical protein VFD43_03030, partial [Planctomycetota bacterium]|nr:hypothetical protein [Planctomycetota bacterium]